EVVERILENTSVNNYLQGEPRVYQFGGHRGDRVWVTLESEDFDARLLLLASDGRVVAEDDDGAGATNARIPSRGVLELPADDLYRIVVTAHDPHTSGAFRLKVENFTHLESIPYATLPVKPGGTVNLSEPAPAAGVNLSGTILYNSINGPAPV